MSKFVRQASLPTVLCLVISLSSAAHGAEAQQRGPRRWAVLPSGPLRDSGLAELVSAQLTGVAGLELVERQDVEAAARELALEKALGESSVANRQRLGRMLRADALILFTIEPAAPGCKQDTLRAVIADTRSGARLRVEDLPYARDRLESLAGRVVAGVNETRVRFASGVKSVVGVPPLLSKDLTHDFDHLQGGFARLIESALTTLPGVAVVELEEARAVQQELATAGDVATVDRIVPVIIEGEYVTSGRSAAGEPPPLVSLTIRTVTTGKPREPITREKLDPKQAAAFLTSELPPLVVGAGIAKDVLTPDQQFRALTARAESFASVGLWTQAISLREAALLLDARAAETRRLIVEETFRLIENDWSTRNRPVYDPNYKPGAAARASALAFARRVIPLAVRGLDHVEYMVRNRQTDLQQAVQMASRTLEGCGFALGHVADEDRAGAEVSSAQAKLREFALRVFPLMYKLAPGEKPTGRIFNPYSTWEHYLFQFALARFGPKSELYSKADFDAALEAARLVPAIPTYPDGLAVGVGLIDYVNRWAGGDGYSSPAQCDRKAFVEFLTSLERSDKRGFVVSARLGRLWLEWHESRLERPTPQQLATLHKLEPQWDALFTHKWERRSGPGIIETFSNKMGLRDEPEPAIVGEAPPSGLPRREGLPPPPGRIRYVPLNLTVSTLTGEQVPLAEREWGVKLVPPETGMSIVHCGERFDVVCTPPSVMFHRRAGVLDEVLAEDGVGYVGAVWDGQLVWVLTHGKGLRVLDAQGVRVADVTEKSGLPPHEQGLMLHPIAPGKVIAVGAFGRPVRAWCAVVELSGKAANVKVIHEATRTLDVAAEEKKSPKRDDPEILASAADPKWGFKPVWIGGARLDGDEAIFVRRGASLSMSLVDSEYRRVLGSAIGVRPLRIDLKTLKVSTISSSAPIPGSVSSGVFLENGEALIASRAVVHVAAPGKVLASGKPSRVVVDAPPGHGWLLASQLVRYDGWIYAPGDVWFRIRPETWQVEALGGGPQPNAWSMMHDFRYGVSAHFGIVGWAGNRVWRVQIVPEREDQSSASRTDPLPVIAARTDEQPRPKWEVRQSRIGDVSVQCEDIRVDIFESNGKRELNVTMPEPLPRTYGEARVRSGASGLVANFDAAAALKVTPQQRERLLAEMGLNSIRYSKDAAQQQRLLELWDAYVAAKDNVRAKQLAQEQVRAAMLERASSYRDFIEKQPDRIRSILTPEQLKAVDRFGDGIYLWPEPHLAGPVTQPTSGPR